MYKTFVLIMAMLMFSFIAFAAEVAVPGLDAPAQAPVILGELSKILGNIPFYLSLLVAFVGAALGIALAIPGDQPDKFLQGCLDFFLIFSKKK